MKRFILFLVFFISVLSLSFCAEDLVFSGIRCGQVLEKADELVFKFESNDTNNLAALQAQNIPGFNDLSASFQAISGNSLASITAGEHQYSLKSTEDRVKWENFRSLMAPWYANWSTLSYRILRITAVTSVMSFVTSHIIAFIWFKLAPLVIYAHLRHHPFLLKHVYFYVIPKSDQHLFEDDFEDDDDFALTAKVNEVLLKIPPSASQAVKDRATQLARMERLRKLKKLKAKRESQEGKTPHKADGASFTGATANATVSDELTREEDDNFKPKEEKITGDRVISPNEDAAAKTSSTTTAEPSKEGKAKEESKGMTLFSVSLTVGMMAAAIFV